MLRFRGVTPGRRKLDDSNCRIGLYTYPVGSCDGSDEMPVRPIRRAASVHRDDDFSVLWIDDGLTKNCGADKLAIAERPDRGLRYAASVHSDPFRLVGVA